MLYRLGQEVVSRLLLPLNDVDDKEKIRDIARTKRYEERRGKGQPGDLFHRGGRQLQGFPSEASRGYADSGGGFRGCAVEMCWEASQGDPELHDRPAKRSWASPSGKPAFVTAIDGVKDQVVLGDNADLFKTEVCSSGNVMFGVRTDVAPMEGSLEKGSPDVTKAETSGGVCTAEDGGSVAGNGGGQVCQTIPDELKAWLGDGIRAEDSAMPQSLRKHR